MEMKMGGLFSVFRWSSRDNAQGRARSVKERMGEQKGKLAICQLFLVIMWRARR